jgi:type II secretory pathway pseudopilin PulG
LKKALSYDVECCKNDNKFFQHGRSMIEMLGVLAIVGVLSAGGVAGYSMAMQNHRTNVLVDKVQIIAQQTRRLYKGEYSQLETDGGIDNLKDLGLVQDITDPFGGNLSVEVSTGSDKARFGVTSKAHLPEEACVDLTLTNWGDCGVFFRIVMQNSSNAITRFNCGEAAYPPTIPAAITACAGGTKEMTIWFK